MLRKLSVKTLSDLAEIKQHLRVEHDLENDLINRYIETAHNFVEDYTSLAIGPQNFEEFLTPDIAENHVFLSMNPVNSITEVIEIDETTGVQTTTTDYISITNSLGVRIKASPNKSYKVTYNAGISLDSLPYQINHAILLSVADMYENREEKVKQKRTSVEYLLNQISIKRI
jgi:uncharacterized phiE125 gp8 family phage protein